MSRLFLTILLTGALSGCKTVDEFVSAINKPQCQRHNENAMEYLAEHPDTTKEVADAIKEGRILIGMTKDQARASWGSRDTVKIDTRGTTWLWKYTDPMGHYITFSDGYHVSSVSTSYSPFTSKYWAECTNHTKKNS